MGSFDALECAVDILGDVGVGCLDCAVFVDFDGKFPDTGYARIGAMRVIVDVTGMGLACAKIIVDAWRGEQYVNGFHCSLGRVPI